MHNFHLWFSFCVIYLFWIMSVNLTDLTVIQVKFNFENSICCSMYPKLLQLEEKIRRVWKKFCNKFDVNHHCNILLSSSNFKLMSRSLNFQLRDSRKRIQKRNDSFFSKFVTEVSLLIAQYLKGMMDCKLMLTIKFLLFHIFSNFVGNSRKYLIVNKFYRHRILSYSLQH